MDNSPVYVVWWKDLLLYQQAQHWFTMGHSTTSLPNTSYHPGSYIRLIHTFIHNTSYHIGSFIRLIHTFIHNTSYHTGSYIRLIHTFIHNTSYHTGSYIRLIHTFILCKDRIPQHYVEFYSVFPIICRSLQPELLEKVVNRALKSAEVPNDMVTTSKRIHCMN